MVSYKERTTPPMEKFAKVFFIIAAIILGWLWISTDYDKREAYKATENEIYNKLDATFKDMSFEDYKSKRVQVCGECSIPDESTLKCNKDMSYKKFIVTVPTRYFENETSCKELKITFNTYFNEQTDDWYFECIDMH